MPETIILLGEEKMEKTLESLKKEFTNIRTGRANPQILNGLTVDYYGVPTPINQMSSISVPEAQLLAIKPYDKGTLKDIEKAILSSNLGLTPLNDGTVIRINFPALTEQRRKELAKQVKSTSENSKVAIRNIRRDVNDQLKKLQKDSQISEDELKEYENEVQKMTDKWIEKIDQAAKEKEKLIMEI